VVENELSVVDVMSSVSVDVWTVVGKVSVEDKIEEVLWTVVVPKRLVYIQLSVKYLNNGKIQLGRHRQLVPSPNKIYRSLSL